MEALFGRIRLLDVAMAGALVALAEAEVALGRVGGARWAAALVALAYTAPLALRRPLHRALRGHRGNAGRRRAAPALVVRLPAVIDGARPGGLN